MILIDRIEIEIWGKKFDAKGNLPKLIAKLIRENTPKSTVLQVPSGSAVNMSGWDGIVKCEEDSGYVPQGISLWEIGANGNSSKANSDYENRKKDSLGFNKKEATYVFVTTAVWANKNEWVANKEKEGVWKSIKAYDSIDIAEWLENSQISSRWFSALANSHPYDGIYTAEEYWKMVSIGPKGQLPPKIVTAGRELESKELLEFLAGKPGLKAIKGSTKEEAIAFILASAMLDNIHSKEAFFSRSVVVDTEHNFHGLRMNKTSINLIAKLNVTGQLYVAAHDNGHHVLVPLGPDDKFGSQDIITLPRIDRDGQVEGLQEMGLTSEEAFRYSKEAGRDYTILKNLLGFVTDEGSWKHHPDVREIVPALLIGRWDEANEGDRIVIEKLSGKSYEKYSDKLYKWLEVEVPPLIKIGSSWRLTSPLDAWTYLSNQLSTRDFENLKECFLEVMREVNPKLEKQSNFEPMISLSSGKSLFSSWCREGFTQSMILIGLHGDKLKLHNNSKGQNWVDDIIKELLYDASGNLWVCRDAEMPLIAEASPRSFFEAAYHSLSLDDKPIMEMFKEEDNWMSPTSNHTGLLWALEGLAWMEEYIYDSSILLAKLSTIDPGGNLSNRPLNSLREIYKPWHYQTLASFENRMKILEQIIKNELETGWNLLSSMISEGWGAAFPTHKLRWRLFEKSFNQNYTYKEIYDTHSMVIDFMIKYFDYSEEKLIVLLKKSESNQLQPDDRTKVFSFIGANIGKIRIKGNTVWHALRKTLSNHRTSPNARWALTENQLKKYELLYQSLEPTDLIDKVMWMFDDPWPSFPEIARRKELSHDKRSNLIAEKRVEGLRKIYEVFGFDTARTLAQTVKEQWVYGNTMANIVNEESEILSLCEYLKGESKILNFIQGFIFKKSLLEGLDWAFDLYVKLKKRNYSEIELARVLIPLEQTSKVWNFVNQTELLTQKSYWGGIHPYFWGLTKEDMIFGVNKLMKVDRFISALDIAYHYPEKLPTAKLTEILEKAGTSQSAEDTRFDGNQVSHILEEIKTRNDIDQSVLINLEWLYLPFITSYMTSQKPTLLHRELSSQPDFFIEVLKWVYNSDNNESNGDMEDISEEAKSNRSRNAYELLHTWKTIPGVNDLGEIDEAYLWDWVEKVRKGSEKVNRLKVADMSIGKILAEYPEKKEPWPPNEICKIIETINTQSLKSGFSSATFNKRGSSSRGVFDGGNIERRHAEYFRAQASHIKTEFPNTAEILSSLAKGYEQDAIRMDESAERDKLDN